MSRFSRLVKGFADHKFPSRVKDLLLSTIARLLLGAFVAATGPLLVIPTLAVAASSATYTFTDLGSLGGGQSSGFAINDLGQVVGQSVAGTATQPICCHGFLWDKGTMSDLGTLDGTTSTATAINDSGTVAGYAAVNGANHAFRWSSGVMTDLGVLALGCCSSQAFGINSQGRIVGVTDTGVAGGFANPHAFLWTAGTMTDLGTLGGNYSSAAAINDVGQIVGAARTGGGVNHAALWENGAITDLTPDAALGSYATAINNNGQIVGNLAFPNGIQHTFLWDSGLLTDLGTIGSDPTASTIAFGINDSGQVTGGGTLSNSTTPEFAFLWTAASGFMDLNTLVQPSAPGQLSEGFGINATGQLTGRYSGGSGGYLLSPTSTAGLPGQPSNVIAAAGDTSARVSWSAPSSGGIPSQYVVSISPVPLSGTGLITVHSSELSLVVGSLSDCIVYTFLVTAQNAAGSGPPSAPVSSHPRPSNPPRVVVILVAGLGDPRPLQPPPMHSGSYDPTANDYCDLGSQGTTPQALTDLAKLFDPNDAPKPSMNLTDSLASVGAILLPYSYNGAGILPNGTFQINGYSQDTVLSTPVGAAATRLDSELQSVHQHWPLARIVIIGHSNGGLVAEIEFMAGVHAAFASAIFSLDGPINGVNPNGTCWSRNVICNVAERLVLCRRFPTICPLLEQYFHLWEVHSARDAQILRKDSSGVFTAVGTCTDEVYAFGDAPADPLQSQLMGTTCGEVAGPHQVITPSAFSSQPCGPDPLNVCFLNNLFASHGLVLRDPTIIALLQSAVAR